jgi:lipopolysaccharide export system permease protein
MTGIMRHRLLSRYFARHFLIWFAVVTLAVSCVILLIDIMELLRRTADNPAIGGQLVLWMALLKLPHTVQQILPFVVLVAAMVTLYRLSRTQELVAARAAGVSVWEFLAPLLLAAFVLGVARLVIINPAAAVILARYESLEARLLGDQASLLSGRGDDVWLRQRDGEPGAAGVNTGGAAVIHAARILPRTLDLRDVTVFRFAPDGAFQSRFDVHKARLERGQWVLEHGWESLPEQAPQRIERVALPTAMTTEQLLDRFATPQTLPIWELPGFITTLRDAGYSALRHRVYLQTLLTAPVLYMAMVLLAAVFALLPPRRRLVLRLTAGGILTGFLLYFAADVITALGISGRLPVWLAAWSPALAATFVSLTILLYREDG